MYKHVAKLIYTHREREREERKKKKERERERRVKSDKIYKLLRKKLIGIAINLKNIITK